MADYTREFLTHRHQDYDENMKNWNFHLRSYLGGDDYTNGYFLNRYILESDEEYLKRQSFTALDNFELISSLNCWSRTCLRISAKPVSSTLNTSLQFGQLISFIFCFFIDVRMFEGDYIKWVNHIEIHHHQNLHKD